MENKISGYYFGKAGELIKSSRSSWPTTTITDKNGKTRTVRVNPAKSQQKPETKRQATQRAKTTSDNEIIANVLAGSKAAQSDLYAKYKGDVYKVISTFVRDTEIAKDLTADVFVKVFSKIEDYSKNAATLPFKTWLIRVSSNTARDYLRSAHAAMQRGEVSEETKQYHFDTMQDSTDPQKSMETKEIASQVHAALAKLPKQYSSAIIEFYFNSLSVKEIAKKYNISESGVQQRLIRGKQALKSILSPDIYKALEPHFEVLDSIYEINIEK